MGAGAMAIVDPLLNVVGLGWTSVLVAGAWILMGPVLFLVVEYGPRWHEQARKGSKRRTRGKSQSKPLDNDLVYQSRRSVL